MNKVLFIAHPYHKKTRSCDFMVEYLKEFYDIEILYCSSSELKKTFDCSKVTNEYSAVIFWQNAPSKKMMNNIHHNNIIFFSMYDGVKDWKSYFGKWHTFKNIKIVSFSLTLHKKLIKWGFNSLYVQYFIKPEKFIAGDVKRVFFWQRRNKDSINLVDKLFCKYMPQIHIHKAIDPTEEFVNPTDIQEKTYNISYSDWFDSKNEMMDYIKDFGIYIAPRRYEGIGMSFLEAMSMGKVIVANDKPTMNEYIQNNETGILCDFSNPKTLDLNEEKIRKIQKNAYEFVQKGYENWINSRKKIIEFINKKEENFVHDKINSKKMGYDFIVGFGDFCQVSWQLRENHLQTKSYPFDWLKDGSCDDIIELFKNNFSNFCNKKDFVYEAMNDYNIGCYKNVQTGFTFLHDFSNTDFEGTYDKVSEKYHRRIIRLLSRFELSQKILVVYRNDEVSLEKIKELHSNLKNKYQNRIIDLLWIKNDKNETNLVIEKVADNIEKAIFDCDLYYGGLRLQNGCEGNCDIYKKLLSRYKLNNKKEYITAYIIYFIKKICSFRRKFINVKISKEKTYLKLLGKTIFQKGGELRV